MNRLDARLPAYKAVTEVRGQAVKYWKSLSLPYPEPGLRLIRQDAIEEFDSQMTEFCSKLNQAVTALNRRYEALKAAAQQRLGSLFNPADYPVTLEGLFKIEWDFPSVEPPNYLRDLHPDLYEQECERVAARFDEAVRLAEQAFIEELHDLVSHLTERLTGQTDGRPRVFRDSIVGNLTEFFQRFQQLNVRSNDDLDRLVEQCQGIVRGVEPQLLRDNQGLRQQVATELTQVENVLDSLLVDRPRRNILRRPK